MSDAGDHDKGHDPDVDMELIGTNLAEDRWRELLSKYQSKRDVYSYFCYHCKLDFAGAVGHCNYQLLILFLYFVPVNFFMPGYKLTTMEFLAEICGEKKEVLYAHDVKRRNIPNWPELGIVNVWPKFQTNARFMKHMPNIKDEPSKELERRFFWGVAATLEEGFVEALIKEAQKKRRE